ncbi:ATP-binding protein [Fulvimonas sp. R45]|uniref:sensor histidine kinase n=1 Tax=Fulvimonas sp. R45 TaxID=3045937 RepID=UPI00265F7343|nr:ATP-binding protein [Fulvimonas sp. R45]MDO1527719.1 ATP-binding protein [Fulvimonas sp. R45]
MIRKGMRDVVALRWRIVGLLFAVLVIVALPYMITRSGVKSALTASEQVTRSAETGALVYRIAYVVRDSEAAIYRMLGGERGANVLVRAQRADHDVPRLLDELRARSDEEPGQQPRADALAAAVNGRLALMDQALLHYQRGDLAGAVSAMQDAGRLYNIDDLTSHVAGSQEDILQARRNDAQAESFDSRMVLAITAGAQILLLAIVVVVSERQIGKRLRAEIREGQAVRRSRMILQAVREPIALLDDQLRTLLVNNAFSELYGVPEEARAAPLEEIGGGAWTDGALLQRLTDVLARDRELWDYELVQRTVDEVERHVVINARRLQRDESDAPTLLLTVSDVTARALAEQQVNELNHQLEGKVAQVSDVNRELEAFSYSVSHDLRAPLRHIAGFAGKLEQHLGEQADERARHYLDVIGSAAQRMAQLIDDLLVFSRLGRGAMRLQPVDMQSLVDEACALAESEAPDRRIEWKIAPLPVVIGDENMLRTVWQNLIGNAVKYTGQRELARIEVGAQRARNGDYEFTVADNGAGFDMQYAGKLFGVFQRLHRASEFPGNGIGLANVRRIVMRHGGRAWAEAEPDQGARFHFTLSAEPAASDKRETR